MPANPSFAIINLYAGQEATVATVRTGHGTTDWFQIGKGVRQGCRLSPCLFNLYSEYIMLKVRLDEAQDGMKIARRNINKFRNADNTMLKAESIKKLKTILMRVKEDSEKANLNQHPKNQGHGFSSIEQVTFKFMAAVSICCDVEAHENKVCHCFHRFPLDLP